MNNEQFRKLMLANAAKSGKDGASAPSATPAGGSTLGSRQRASIPMTPRGVGGGQSEFARQLAERNNAGKPQRKFRSFVPRGVKLGSGYTDRTQEREEEAADDREERLKALEKSLKDEEIDQGTFDKLRFEIAGGDLSSTHLVKGLDFKLLERIRRGEDLDAKKEEEEVVAEDEEEVADVDDEFDQLEDKEVHSVEKAQAVKKKGQLSTVSLAPGKKRTRDQILAELKASREAAKAKEDALGDRFKRIGAKQLPGARIERDSKGREVLIIVDEDGHEKRKIRKIQPNAATEDEDRGLLMPDKDAKPLGMEVPEQYRKQEEKEPEEEEDIDIFDGVGDDYDPLAGMDGSDSDSDDDKDEKKDDSKTSKNKEEGEVADTSMTPPPKPVAPRNYFKDAKTGLVSEEQIKAPSMSDPAIMAAIKRAAALNPIATERDGEDDEDLSKTKAAEERRRKMLEISNRDEQDLDMGFGTSRFEDEEDFNENKVKLSVWGKDGDDDEGKSKGGQGKRKRAPKKRKGDVNSAADVLRVMEERKKS